MNAQCQLSGHLFHTSWLSILLHYIKPSQSGLYSAFVCNKKNNIQQTHKRLESIKTVARTMRRTE